ncbi:MAG: hypothetical protein WAM85_11955 [Terracidiphilus sp.]
MKDWVVILVIVFACIYISASISAIANTLAAALSELAEKIGELNDKVDSIVSDVADIEGVVSGRKEKYINPIDL